MQTESHFDKTQTNISYIEETDPRMDMPRKFTEYKATKHGMNNKG